MPVGRAAPEWLRAQCPAEQPGLWLAGGSLIMNYGTYGLALPHSVLWALRTVAWPVVGVQPHGQRRDLRLPSDLGERVEPVMAWEPVLASPGNHRHDRLLPGVFDLPGQCADPLHQHRHQQSRGHRRIPRVRDLCRRGNWLGGRSRRPASGAETPSLLLPCASTLLLELAPGQCVGRFLGRVLAGSAKGPCRHRSSSASAGQGKRRDHRWGVSVHRTGHRFESNWDVAGALEVLYGDPSIRGDVTSANLEIGRGLTTTLYGDDRAHYRYGHDLILYDRRRSTVVRLPEPGARGGTWRGCRLAVPRVLRAMTSRSSPWTSVSDSWSCGTSSGNRHS